MKPSKQAGYLAPSASSKGGQDAWSERPDLPYDSHTAGACVDHMEFIFKEPMALVQVQGLPAARRRRRVDSEPSAAERVKKVCHTVSL